MGKSEIKIRHTWVAIFVFRYELFLYKMCLSLIIFSTLLLIFVVLKILLSYIFRTPITTIYNQNLPTILRPILKQLKERCLYTMLRQHHQIATRWGYSLFLCNESNDKKKKNFRFKWWYPIRRFPNIIFNWITIRYRCFFLPNCSWPRRQRRNNSDHIGWRTGEQHVKYWHRFTLKLKRH